MRRRVVVHDGAEEGFGGHADGLDAEAVLHGGFGAAGEVLRDAGFLRISLNSGTIGFFVIIFPFPFCAQLRKKFLTIRSSRL